jgi:formylglycine-generating enzyme required for sulfatase activity
MMKLVWCPPGAFTMGSPATEKFRSPDENQVGVTLTHGFWAAATETTQGQWMALMGASSQPWKGREFLHDGPNFPAMHISHGMNADRTIELFSATAFCEKLTTIERAAGRLPAGWKYALPTEAQWEYMCRAGTKTKYSFGDDETSLGEYAWFAGNAYEIGENYARTVGTRKPNPWGFFDLHGNVYEWCRDGYSHKLLGGRDPLNASAINRRVLRGGSWINNSASARSAIRDGAAPDERSHLIGFRVVRTQ